jgi:hypothetical protein
MKKSLLFLSIATLVFTMHKAQAQFQYPIISASADDFEVWADDPVNSSVKDPNTGNFNTPSWECLNPLTYFLLGSSPQSVYKDSAVIHSGSYSCKIISVALTNTSYNYVKSFVPHDTVGIVLTATITNAPAIKPGAPFTSRISSFNFWYQYAPQFMAGKPDTASCQILLTKNHVAIGAGKILMNAAASWTQGNININYFMAGNPDSITVIFSAASLFKPALGSMLIIDGVTPLGLNEVAASPEVNVEVYPNPSCSTTNFRISGENGRSLKVYDITGKEVNTYTIKDNMLTINTCNYPTGMYVYQLADRDGKLIKVGKFNVER